MSDAKLKIYRFAELLISVLYPDRCIICGNVLVFGTDKPICDDCRNEVTLVAEAASSCKKCSRPIGEERILCGLCHVVKYHYNRAYSCLIYKGKMRQSLLRYKFRNKRYLFRPFADIMAARLQNVRPDMDFDMLLFVPSSQNRIKRRGYDHMRLIARRIAKICKLSIAENGITKTKDTPPQSKLSYSERLGSVKGAFEINREIDFKAKRILLIDDIYTTGATADEISRLLKRRGAAHITVLTLCITQEEK